MASSSQTPNLRLYTPPAGTNQWTQLGNYNWRTIDTSYGTMLVAVTGAVQQFNNMYQGVYSAETLYSRSQIVTTNPNSTDPNNPPRAWISLQAINLNQAPALGSSYWGLLSSSTPGIGFQMRGAFSSEVTYGFQDVAIGTDDNAYSSLVEGNIGNTPQTSPSEWILFLKSGTDGATTPNFTAQIVAPVGIEFPDSTVITWSATKQFRDGILDVTGTRYLSYAELDNTIHCPLPVDALEQIGIPAGIVTNGLDVKFPGQVIDPTDSGEFSNTQHINSGTVDETGLYIVGTAEVTPKPTAFVVSNPPIDLDGPIDAPAAQIALHLVTCGGQSVEYGSDGTPLINTTPSATNLMPANGIDHDFNSGVSPTATPIALVEQITQTGKIAFSESVAAKVASRGFKHVMGIASSALPGASLDQINQGTAPWSDMLAQITQFHSYAVSGGKSFRHAIHQFDQGQTEGSPSTWQAGMVTYQQQLEAASNAITGNTGHIPLHIMQNDVIFMAQYQQNLEILYPDCFRIVGADYCLEHHPAADSVSSYHLTANGYMMKGEQYAKAYKWEVLQRRRWRNLQPLYATPDRYNVKIKYFVPYGQIAFDTSRVVNALDGFYGFKVSNANILSVAITGDDEVTIALDRCVPKGMRLSYGDAAYGNTDTTGRLNGQAGGCLVDDWPEMSLYPDTTLGSTYQMKNYSNLWAYVIS